MDLEEEWEQEDDVDDDDDERAASVLRSGAMRSFPPLMGDERA